jgi:hypothetical protein
MQKRLWVVIVIAALLLASCGPATVPTTSPETASGEIFMIALPRIVVDYDTEGNPAEILGIDLSKLPFQFAALKLPPETIARLTSSNIQHVEMAFVGHGVTVTLTASRCPTSVGMMPLSNRHSTWQGLGQTEHGLVQADGAHADSAWDRSGSAFPGAPGASEIAMTNPGERGQAGYHANYSRAVGDRYLRDQVRRKWEPRNPGHHRRRSGSSGDSAQVGLPPSTISALQEANIQNMEMQSQPSGLYVYVNNGVLPNLTWDPTLLTNLAELMVQLSPNSAYNDVIMGVVPNLDKLYLDILIHFPLAPGAEPIPAQMHS